MPPVDRIAAMAGAVVNEVQWPDCALGIVLSSGPAVSLSATDPEVENVVAESDHGLFVRRLIAPYLGRETIITPVSDRGWAAGQRWRDAHRSEDAWLDADLGAAQFPPLNQFWS